MSSSASRTQSSSRAATTALRPRTKRFITGLEDLSPEASINGNPTSINSTPYDTPYESRLPSPLPSKHPSRTSSRNPSRNRASRNTLNAGFARESSDLASSLSGFWGKSWTNLQGLASTVLGSDAVEPIKDNIKIPTRNKRTVDVNGAKQWGTSMSRQTSEPGTGSQEQRKALVIAKKREELLKRVDSDQYLSTKSQYKRRTSDEFESISAPPGQAEERDALVYIYNVQPTDTLPGISIKFNCPLPTIKKANRLWSNDVMVSRKTLLIPVEACNVKGRRVAGPEQKGMDFLSDLSETHDRRSSEATITPTTLQSHTMTSIDLASSTTHPQTDEPWTHDSWILLSAHPTAIEIARMSRRDLGFFPRARRKSNANSSYSDLDTPSESFDLPRPPSIIISDTATTQPITKHKSRRSSSSHAFAPKMIGPGGVGTLVGKGPSAPGPGEDKLSKAFQRALPKFANPGQPVFDEILEPEYTSGTLTPTSHAFENVGSTLEGWVRKMADRAAKVVEPPSPNLKLGRQTGIRHGGMGDLIELEDAFELGGHAGDEGDVLPDPDAFAAFEDDEPARGRERGSRRVGSTALQDAGAAGLTVRSAMAAARKKGD